ncbi:hypothetical protein DFH06DRAFT_1145176 [Mycena polygramma]|nr:hypothetical protein DFH06DRAFT_1145176 [Mycena polygramma]
MYVRAENELQPHMYYIQDYNIVKKQADMISDKRIVPLVVCWRVREREKQKARRSRERGWDFGDKGFHASLRSALRSTRVAARWRMQTATHFVTGNREHGHARARRPLRGRNPSPQEARFCALVGIGGWLDKRMNVTSAQDSGLAGIEAVMCGCRDCGVSRRDRREKEAGVPRISMKTDARTPLHNAARRAMRRRSSPPSTRAEGGSIKVECGRNALEKGLRIKLTVRETDEGSALAAGDKAGFWLRESVHRDLGGGVDPLGSMQSTIVGRQRVRKVEEQRRRGRKGRGNIFETPMITNTAATLTRWRG